MDYKGAFDTGEYRNLFWNMVIPGRKLTAA